MKIYKYIYTHINIYVNRVKQPLKKNGFLPNTRKPHVPTLPSYLTGYTP